ncbi:MAG TPA: prolyl aminopeptidase [Gammaproteobacteria bacterium]|nr:prolyl aminopeptidase [Gammaproteobacteria bacterium]
MRTLYPPLEPYSHFELAVDARHTLYVEQAGNPEGLPVVFLHGGPGAGSEPWHRQFFDPEGYRIVVFDQRGAGRSRPHAELADNTTPLLVSDMEKIRTRLGIERWVVFGGSWGSTLALAYAEAYPERVLGLVLRGIFLCRPQDIHWFYQEGANRVFPDYWEDFVAPIPPAERHDMLRAYHRRLTSDDERVRLEAARAWSVWEGRCATLLPNPAVVESFANPHTALSLARIECHYFVNDCFLAPDQLLRDAHRLRGIPGYIVHGRFDIVCPLDGAHALAKVWSEAEFHIVRDAGHVASEPGIQSALVEATDALLARLAPRA